ncbi:MAG: CDP-alcohol phosphatidyltransferase family protein [Holophagales bacterium]|nr:CDP-alcohol phosphatidyltransferase family protein [Holophagales bacterium]
MLIEKAELPVSGHPQDIVKPACFGNWADLYGYPLSYRILPWVARLDGLTPNFVTLGSFFLYLLGCVLLIWPVPHHLALASVLLLIAYLGDQLDGQLARLKNLSSAIGNYLDKVVDVFKVYAITLSLSVAVFRETGQVTPVFLGFTACFFFNFRYYIKLETVLSQASRDPSYLARCTARADALSSSIQQEYRRLSAGSTSDRLRLLWIKNRTFFFVDEAELVVVTAAMALFDRLDLALWILALSQVILALWRVAQRGHQTHHDSSKLLDPMRK